ncbi:MAG: beta-galactosidase trimerization domain-containing protein [Myxococcota bacterium]
MPLRTALAASALAVATALPEGAPVETREPDVAAELRAFSASPPAWSADVVNAVLGEGPIAQRERQAGWLSEPENWELVDFVERASNYSTHGWLARRGIASEHYGYNEYQETIALRPEGALALFGERGLARGPLGELMIDPNKEPPGSAFIADPLEPRWAAVLAYDQATTPLFGDATAQDNIGGPLWRMGPDALGHFGEAASRGFAAWRARRGESPLASIRSHLRDRHGAQLSALRPYAAPEAFSERRASDAAQSLCGDPVVADYLIFLHAANLAAWARHYTDLRQIAERAGRAFDVHGNLGGGLVGPDVYPMSLASLVDSVWFETSGVAQYDQLRHGWWSAWGALRLELGEALAGAAKPLYFLARPEKVTPDLLALELAEVSAGGGVPIANPDLLASDAPDALPALGDFLRLRDQHRAVYETRGRTRLADVALLYSVATVLFDPCVPEASSSDTPVLNDLAGAARALEEGHVPYDAVVLPHPELRTAQPRDPDLARYRVVIAPSLERLSDADLERLTRYLRGGGTLAVLGRLGERDERNAARAAPPLAALRRAGRVVVLLGGGSFPGSRGPVGPASRERSARFLAEIGALTPRPLVGGELAPTTWVKTWRHAGGFVSAHFVSYAVDFETGAATPARSTPFELRVPRGVRAESARWFAPGEPERELPLRVTGETAQVALPPLRVYGVLVLGPAGAEARASALARGDRRLSRASMAGAGAPDLERRIAAAAELRRGDARAYAEAAASLLRELSAERERDYLERIRSFAELGEATAAFSFGSERAASPWRAVSGETGYSQGLGYGWLPADDDSLASPEEKDYLIALSVDPDALRSVSLYAPYWPYAEAALPAPIARALVSGRSRVFRIDLPDGDYRVSVVGANGAWNQLGLAVSGMVFANGAPALLDVPLDRGSIARRAFTTHVAGGRLELRFGGPTGFGVAALLVEPAARLEPDSLEAGALRSWSVSERHPNPDWLPLRDLVVPKTQRATELRAAESGIPLVDLGTNAHAAVGDVVVASADAERAEAGPAQLRVGASSSARVYLNGALVLELANVKGVERDEGRATVRLRKGPNRLEVVLERFWERRWLFFASLH